MGDLFFAVAPRVNRASDPPVACGHGLSCCFFFSTRTPNGTVSYATPNESPNKAFLSVRYRVARASMIWYDMV